ncbi:hypothetical protein [Kribbella italica]|uniref:Beta/gamma crystallin 'Greek key' domain-containing protein n=1 Tax=Kribbella italica TaxID=1540520 RepID=A0A7W9J717_9ACTN|nr:hypothetical protein [Kribbella italica]MBB5836098.1 hypothetical protein [Kribbella italica]
MKMKMIHAGSTVLVSAGLLLGSPAVAQAGQTSESSTRASDLSVIDPIGFYAVFMAEHPKKESLYLTSTTKFQMICWYQWPGFERRSYGEIKSGKHSGKFGNIDLKWVKDEIVVDRCK